MYPMLPMRPSMRGRLLASHAFRAKTLAGMCLFQAHLVRSLKSYDVALPMFDGCNSCQRVVHSGRSSLLLV